MLPSSSFGLPLDPSTGGNGLALGLGLGIGIPALIAVGLAIAFAVFVIRNRLRWRPMELAELEMLMLTEKEEQAVAASSLYISKTILCFTSAITVEVGKAYQDRIVLRNHSPKAVTVSFPSIPKSHKFSLVVTPSATTIVPSKGDILLTFELTLNCTTTINLDIPLDIGGGGVKARITSAVSGAPSYLLDGDELKVGEKLGEGASASVFRGNWRGLDVALKCFKMSEIDPDVREKYLAEAKLLMGLHHPHITCLFGLCERPQLTMVMEFAPHGSLTVAIQKNKLEPM